jgi:inner membrane protein
MPECYNKAESTNTMLLLAHAGITLGAATVLAGVVKSRHATDIRKVSWFTSLSGYIDIRLLLVGSLLPDIIDKPVGQFFFREIFQNGRIFSHTLVFLVLITVVGFCLHQSRRQVWLLTLASGTFMHLVLDEMWRAPRTLFWPFLGFTFDKVELTYWASNILQALMSDPEVYVSEAAGIAILLWFGLALAGRKKVGAFLKYGKLN